MTAPATVYRLSVTATTLIEKSMHLGDYHDQDAAFAVKTKLAEAAPELYGAAGKYRLTVEAVS